MTNMETLFVLLFVTAIIGGFAWLIIYIYYAAKKRREEMAKVAKQLSLNYQADDDLEREKVYSDISLFNIGHSREALNVIGGNKDNYYVDIFDYKYVTGAGKNSQLHSNSVCVLTIPQSFRFLSIRPENFLDKIVAAIGFDDIDFESKEFSSRYCVKSNDKKFAYDIIHPQMMGFLLSTETPFIEINGSHMVFYIEKRIKPEGYIGLYNFAAEFYKKTPNYVLEEYAVTN